MKKTLKRIGGLWPIILIFVPPSVADAILEMAKAIVGQ